MATNIQWKDLRHSTAEIDQNIDDATAHHADTTKHITSAERTAWNQNTSDIAAANGNISALQTGKVDKVAGKQLSTNDYTTAEKTKLAGLNNYDDAEVLADISTQGAVLAGILDSGAKNRVIVGFPETTKSGITATPNEDGSITLNGTNSGSSSTILVFDLYAQASVSTDNKQNPFAENGRYIFTGSGSNSVRIQLYGYNDDLQLSVIANSSDNVEFTVDGTYKYYVFRIWIAGGASFDTSGLLLCAALLRSMLYQTSSVNTFRP